MHLEIYFKNILKNTTRISQNCLLNFGIKNTLLKNYLWFAERAGARVLPERTVVDIKPLRALDGSDGYAVTTERSVSKTSSRSSADSGRSLHPGLEAAAKRTTATPITPCWERSSRRSPAGTSPTPFRRCSSRRWDWKTPAS